MTPRQLCNYVFGARVAACADQEELDGFLADLEAPLGRDRRAAERRAISGLTGRL